MSRDGSTDARARPGLAARNAKVLAAVALVLLWTLAFTRGYRSTNDGSAIALARAIAEEGRLQIGSYWYYTLGVDGACRNGHYYSDRWPGAAAAASVVVAMARPLAALLGLPPSWAAETGATLLAVAFGMAGLLATAALVRLLGGGDADAAIAVIALGLGTLHLVYSTRLFAHVPTGAVLAGAAWLLWRSARGEAAPLDAVVGGLLAGLSVCFSGSAALMWPLLAWPSLTAWRRSHPGEGFGATRTPVLLAWAVGPVLLAAYNWACFGAPWRTGLAYQVAFPWAHSIADTFSGPCLRGVVLLVFGTEAYTGLLSHSPVVLFALVGWLAPRPVRAYGTPIALGALAWLLILAKHRGLFADGWGTRDYRHIVHLLPLLMAGLGLAWSWMTRRWKTVAGLLGVYSAARALLAALPGSGYGDALRAARALGRGSPMALTLAVLRTPRLLFLGFVLLATAWAGWFWLLPRKGGPGHEHAASH